MSKESLQKKLTRVRKPRVHLTYDVEIGGAIEKKELPFVLGVVGDFSGNKANEDNPKKKLQDREFSSIDRDNFDTIMNGIAPSVSYQVNDVISAGGGKMNVNITFNKMDDFAPANVAAAIPQLAELLEMRSRLSDLKSKLISNESFEDAVRELFSDKETIKKIASSKKIENNAQE